MRALRLALVLALVSPATSTCWLDGDLKQRRTTVPEPLGDGWEIATPESVGLDPVVLEALHREILREDRFVGMQSFLVVKDGKLVWETYLRAASDRDRVHHVQSMTKSVTSLAVGTMIARGELAGVSATVLDMFPIEGAELDPVKRTITLEHLLTMRSGLDLDNDHFSIELWCDKPADPLRYMLGKPLASAPGERYDYRDIDPQIVGYALTRATGLSEEALVTERIFAPLGIDDIAWEAGRDGVSHAAHSLWLRPRDLAKLGQLALQRGAWDGEQLVPAAWIDEATRAHVTSGQVTEDGTPIGYGYYWWVVPDLGFTMAGHGGQYVFVVPGAELVVVTTGYADAELHGSWIADFVPLVEMIVE